MTPEELRHLAGVVHRVRTGVAGTNELYEVEKSLRLALKHRSDSATELLDLLRGTAEPGVASLPERTRCAKALPDPPCEHEWFTEAGRRICAHCGSGSPELEAR